MTTFSRRGALITGAAALFAPTLGRAVEDNARSDVVVRRNVSSFVSQDWRDHFETLDLGAILCDTASRALHWWSADDADYRVYPTSVPKTDELTRRGYSRIVRKKVGPSWTPTPSQLERFPDWEPIAGGAPNNPLGSHALYLDWPAYLIHGTHDTRKIGRPSSDGCIGLYNHKIEELFALVPVGTQVRLI